jgi:hypothetical protein
MAIPKTEVNAILKIFQRAEEEAWDDVEEAEQIILALNEVREKSKKYVVVANLQWPDDKDFHLFAAGPFNTVNQAEAVGQRFAADPQTHKGKGRWRVVPILPPVGPSSKQAWDHVKPPERRPCCSLHHGWLKDEIGLWTWLKADPGTEHWKEKGGW